MANRIIRESILTSATMAQISDSAARLWKRILLKTDDYGCLEATPEVVRGVCFPLLLNRWSVKKVIKHLDELGQAGLLGFWVDGTRIFALHLRWDDHNSFSNARSVTEDGKQTRHRRKTPEPPPKPQLERLISNLRPTQSNLVQSSPNPTPNPTPNPKRKDIYITPTSKEGIILKTVFPELRNPDDLVRRCRENLAGKDWDWEYEARRCRNWHETDTPDQTRRNWPNAMATWATNHKPRRTQVARPTLTDAEIREALG